MFNPLFLQIELLKIVLTVYVTAILVTLVVVVFLDE
jgi:hypothetical protein